MFRDGQRSPAFCGLPSYNPLLSGGVNITRFAVQGGPEAEGGIHTLTVGPGFFETMGIPVVTGRTFTSRDDQNAAKVAIINEAAARKYFPDSNPLGRRFGNLPETSSEFEIIGIVRDASYNSLREAAPPTKYMAFLQSPLRGATFELRTSIDPTGAMAAIRQAVREIDAEVPVTGLSTQIQQIEGLVDQEKKFATTYAVFGGLALLLSSIGLFGLMSYSVTRRTNEIGVRMALGAKSQDVVKVVMRESMLIVAIGIVIGLAAAIGAGRLVATLLFGLAPTDGLTIGIAMLVMIAVSALAGYLPARRASRVDPLTALRYE